MRTNTILAISVGALATLFSACGAPATNNSNSIAKPANANANVVNSANNSSISNAPSANAATAPAVEGQVIKIEEGGIQVTVPKGFKFSKDGEDTVIQSEDDGVDIRFSVPKDGDYAKSVTDAAKEIDSYLNDVKSDSKEPQKRDVNGMEGTSLTGTAKTEEGEPVIWNLTIINAPKNPVLANIYAEKTSLDKYAAGVKACLDSVKKL